MAEVTLFQMCHVKGSRVTYVAMREKGSRDIVEYELRIDEFLGGKNEIYLQSTRFANFPYLTAGRDILS